MDAPIKLKYLTAQREKMSPLVKGYWSDLDQAHDLGRPVVYCLGLIPQELFRTVDATIFFGENFGAGCAVARVSKELCEVAEAQGFPMELCSYVRTSIGAMLTGRNPMGKTLPKPDLVAYCNGRCSAYAGWGKAIKELYPDVPVFAVDIPPLTENMTGDDHTRAIDYLKQQFEEIITFLDGWRGQRFDRERLAELVDNTGRGARAFVALQDTLRQRPAPLSLIDIFFQLFPMVCLKGRSEMADYYTAAKAEVDQRIAEGFSAVPDERFRIYWDGIAIWTRLTNQFQQLARHGASLVSSAYAHNMADSCAEYDATRPLESFATSLLHSFNNRTLQDKVSYVEKLATGFAADGIIMQVSRSCKPYFVDEQAIMKQVHERTGIPYCEVHGDMADPRLYSEQEIENRIETFLDGLVQRR